MWEREKERNWKKEYDKNEQDREEEKERWNKKEEQKEDTVCLFRRKPFESLLAVKESIMLSQSRQMWTTAKLNTRFLSRTWLSAHCGVTTHAHTRTHTRTHALTHTWKRTINENVQTLSCHLRNDHTAKKFMLGKNRYSRIDPV